MLKWWREFTAGRRSRNSLLKNKPLFIFIAIIIVIYSAASLALHSFKDAKNSEVQHYLIEKLGYSETDFYTIYTEIGKLPLVSTTVIFRDEPYARYFYRKENGHIYQYSSAPVEGVNPDYLYKHKEKYE